MLTLFSSALMFAAAGIGPHGSCIKEREVQGIERAWYRDNETIRVQSKRYAKYGLPRDIPLDEVEWIADHDGVPVMAEKGAAEREVVYLLSDKAGCQLQPYQVQSAH